MTKLKKRQFSCWYKTHPREPGWHSTGQLSSDTMAGLKEKVRRFSTEQRQDTTKIEFDRVEEVTVTVRTMKAFRTVQL